MESVDILTFLGGLRDIRELSAGLARFCTDSGLLALGVSTGMEELYSHCPDNVVTHDMFLFAQLCGLQDTTQRAFPVTESVTEIGRAAMECVGKAVLGSDNISCDQQLTQALSLSSVRTVLAARQLCLKAFQASISPSNCFRIFRFADSCNIAPLREVAEKACLANIPQTGECGQDEQGFFELQPQQLQHLLQSDALQVPSELAVFSAAMSWVCAQPIERMPLVGSLINSCVRLGSMDVRQLEELDQDPHVLASRELTRLVAHVYVTRIMGMSYEPYGNCRPRLSVARGGVGVGAAPGVESCFGEGACVRVWKGRAVP